MRDPVLMILLERYHGSSTQASGVFSGPASACEPRTTAPRPRSGAVHVADPCKSIPVLPSSASSTSVPPCSPGTESYQSEYAFGAMGGLDRPRAIVRQKCDRRETADGSVARTLSELCHGIERIHLRGAAREGFPHTDLSGCPGEKGRRRSPTLAPGHSGGGPDSVARVCPTSPGQPSIWPARRHGLRDA